MKNLVFGFALIGQRMRARQPTLGVRNGNEKQLYNRDERPIPNSLVANPSLWQCYQRQSLGSPRWGR